MSIDNKVMTAIKSAIKELIEIRDMIRTDELKSEIKIGDDDILKKLNDIEEKLDNLNNLNFNKDSAMPDGPVKVKRKKEIVNLLLKHKKLTATQLSYFIKISRTRCNEYLKELEGSGMVKGDLIDKKKYYELV